MGKVKIELNIDGLRELRRSDEIYSVCERYANEIANTADGEFSVERGGKTTRHYAKIISSDARTNMRQLKISPNIQDILFSRLVK